MAEFDALMDHESRITKLEGTVTFLTEMLKGQQQAAQQQASDAQQKERAELGRLKRLEAKINEQKSEGVANDDSSTVGKYREREPRVQMAQS